jgi:hypothetical protein
MFHHVMLEKGLVWSFSMGNKDSNSRDLPEEIKRAVGIDRAKAASEIASKAAQRLDRENQLHQEPSHVYRAVSWSVKK